MLTQNEAAIQQINLSYSVEQDRLLLRVGLADNSELLVWLTNRFTRLLWQLLNGEANIQLLHPFGLKHRQNMLWDSLSKKFK